MGHVWVGRVGGGACEVQQCFVKSTLVLEDTY